MTTKIFPNKFLSLHQGEEAIRAQNIEYIISNEALLLHLSTIEKSMDIINHFYWNYRNENEEQKIIQILGVQIFNQSASALKLILSGYYHASISIQRSLLETLFLLDYFSTDSKLIIEWHKSNKNMRTRGKFSPFNVRDFLDKRDGFKEKKRQEHYERLCELGTHPTPVSFTMLTPTLGGDFYCGPFFSAELTKGAIEELIKINIQIGGKFSQFFKPKTSNDYAVKILFAESHGKWFQRFYKTEFPNQPEIEELKKLLKKIKSDY